MSHLLSVIGMVLFLTATWLSHGQLWACPTVNFDPMLITQFDLFEPKLIGNLETRLDPKAWRGTYIDIGLNRDPSDLECNA